MYENPDKVALALYFGYKIIDKNGRFIYKPFPTLQHIHHEIFVFAYKFNFEKVYGYEQGEYMPYSPLIEQGIKENFVYNPVFDHYECNTVYDHEFDNWLKRNDKFRNEIISIRTRCEKYNAKQLYIIMYEHEKEYIKNIRKKDSDIGKYRTEISRTIGSMRYDLIEGNKITQEKYNELQDYFETIL